MENLTLSIEGYIEVKKKIKEKLNETVHNFIIIGYYLKQVRDSGAFREDGYKNMEEFAHAEYGLSAGTASRFMDINTEFSKDGSSLEIKDEYRNFAYSKLQEMLTVVPEDRQLITENTTVQQIREIKKAEKEEKQAEKKKEQENLPIVQMTAQESSAQDPEAEQPVIADSFEYIIENFWKENGELYQKAAAGMLTPEIAAEEICPSGSRIYRCGISMLFFYDIDKGMKLRTYVDGSPAILQYTYQDLLDKTADMDIAFPQKKDDPTPEEPVATPQDGQAEPENAENTKTNEAPETTESTDTENVIDGEYRELDSGKKEDGEKNDENMSEAEYTDIEIKNAINYFDIEYLRMSGLGQDTPKRRNYKIALECIRKCYRSIAKQVDEENYRGV